MTSDTDTIATRRAVRYYDDRKGSQRSNSTAHEMAVSEIRASANPMAAAEKLLRQLNGDRSRGDRKAIRALCKGDVGRRVETFTDLPDDTIPEKRAVTTRDIDALERFLRGRYPGGRLDDCHYRLIQRLEEKVFAAGLTVSDFVDAGLAALQIEVYVPSRNVWVSASK